MLPQQRLKVSYCMIEVAEFYHVALHIAAETMQFASQDFRPRRNYARPGLATFQSRTRLPKRASRLRFCSHRAAARTRRAPTASCTRPRSRARLFSAPCSRDRWMPANVLDEHRQYFVPLLQRAQNVVCKDEYRLPIPPPIMTLYSAQLSSLGGYSPASIAPWMPPVTAAMIGIRAHDDVQLAAPLRHRHRGRSC